MKIKDKIEQEVEKTLASLDSLQPAEMPPFFYTRLQARLSAKQHSMLVLIPDFLQRPVWVIAGLATMIIVNIAIITSLSSVSSHESNYAQSFAAEYQLLSESFYDSNK
jgi:hypothetical protein